MASINGREIRLSRSIFDGLNVRQDGTGGFNKKDKTKHISDNYYRRPRLLRLGFYGRKKLSISGGLFKLDRS